MWSHVGDEQRIIHVSFILKYFAPPSHSRRYIPPFIHGSSFLQLAYLSLECFQSSSRLVCRLLLLLLPICERARLKRRCCLSRLVKTEIPSSPPPSSHFFSFFLFFLLSPWRPAHKVSSPSRLQVNHTACQSVLCADSIISKGPQVFVQRCSLR